MIRSPHAYVLVAALLGCAPDAPTTTGGGATQGGSDAAGGGTTGGGATSQGGAGAGGVSAGGAATGGAGPAPDFDDLPWETGDAIGFGVAFKDTHNPGGASAFVGYGGYAITLGAAQEWVEALYRAELEARGVRFVFAVQGPADITYTGFEIGNSKVAAALVDRLGPAPATVTIAAHSSGTFVAHELLGQLATDRDPGGITAGRVDYFNLDGGSLYLTPAAVDRLRSAHFVAAFDPAIGTYSPNQVTMASLGASYASKGGYLELDASGSGCVLGAIWCLHMTPILTVPHDPAAASNDLDYSDFAGRAVTTSYLDTITP